MFYVYFVKNSYLCKKGNGRCLNDTKLLLYLQSENQNNPGKMKTTATDTTATKWIAYYRTSTKSQHLGLKAQQMKVQQAAQESGATILEEIEEQESGKECNRPGLNRAMALARKHGATLVVAKHDRISRDLAFAANTVLKSDVNFKILNFPPEAMTDPLLFGVYYGMAQREAQLISERTKDALAKLKAQGVVLGNPNGARAIIKDEVKAKSAESKRRKADENANNVAASNEIKRFATTGVKRTLQAIADHLNNNGFYTSTGREHTRKSVQLLCKRYDIAI